MSQDLAKSAADRAIRYFLISFVDLFGVLRENGYPMIHADADGELQGLKHFGEDGLDAAAEGQGLRCIGLRQQHRELVAADSECRVGVAQRPLESRGCGPQDFVALRVAVLVVHFLEAVKVQDQQP